MKLEDVKCEDGSDADGSTFRQLSSESSLTELARQSRPVVEVERLDMDR